MHELVHRGSDGVERVRDEARARTLVAELNASGLTVAAFCKARRIASWTLYEWRKRIEEPPRLLEVRVSAAPVPVAEPAVYEVALANGRSVRVGDTFREETLVRLVAALERRC
jgi:hypothetical protein